MIKELVFTLFLDVLNGYTKAKLHEKNVINY